MLSNIRSANDSNEISGSSYYKKPGSTTKKKSTEKPGASSTRQQPSQRQDYSHISSEARQSPRVGAPGGLLEGFGRNFGRAASPNAQGTPGAQAPNAQPGANDNENIRLPEGPTNNIISNPPPAPSTPAPAPAPSGGGETLIA